jgi:hypothetical protein
MQQSLGRVLGVLDYDAHPHGIRRAVDYLLASVDASVNCPFFDLFRITHD